MGSSGTITIAQQLAETLFFCTIPDDILLNILCRLDNDPRDLARLACVSTRFCKAIKTVCWKFRCEKTLPLLVAELLQAPSPALHPSPEPPGGWAALQKLLVCCPGLRHAGVLLENWDFGLDRELRWFDNVACSRMFFPAGVTSEILKGPHLCDRPSKKARNKQPTSIAISQESITAELCTGTSCSESDRACTHGYEDSEGIQCHGHGVEIESNGLDKEIHNIETDGREAIMDIDRMKWGWNKVGCNNEGGTVTYTRGPVGASAVACPNLKDLEQTDQEKQKQEDRRKSCQHELCHVATGPWNFSREQGNKLLANRFRADSLYICDWPGCIHPGDKRIYKLFRGVFKNFKSSHVWRNLKDMQAKATNVGCAFCVCKSTWDMATTFCLKRSIEFHDDGEPVVTAYVCENGHVAGAWTDRPMYTP